MRIKLETDAFYLILKAIQDKKYAIIVSSVHIAEIEAITDIQERQKLLSLLAVLGKTPEIDQSELRKRAEELHSKSFGVADAAHVAFAEKTTDFFITCDDKLLKKCRKMVVDKKLKVTALNPVTFCMKEENHHYDQEH